MNFKTIFSILRRRKSSGASALQGYSIRKGMLMFTCISILAAAVAVFVPSCAEAGKADKNTDKNESEQHFLSDKFLDNYLKIAGSLADDSLKGVGESARQMDIPLDAFLKKRDGTKEPDEPSDIAELISLQAKLLQNEKLDIASARGIFGVISDRVASVFSSEYSGADKDKYHIFYCPMAKRYWIQKDRKIRNPFYGPSMIDCGSEVKTVKLEAAAPSRTVNNEGHEEMEEKSEEADDPFAVVDAPPSPRAESIMKKMICTCCGKPLLPITCGCARGLANKVKGQISEMEDQGLSDSDIVVKLREVYGNRVVPEKLSVEGAR